MGVWTWLRRGDGDQFEEIHTHRAWHALHVALTGCEQKGEPPASWVVWTSPGAVEATFEHWPGELDMVQSGALRDTFGRVRRSIHRG